MIKVKRWELLRGLFLEGRVKGLVVIPTIKRLSQDKRGGKRTHGQDRSHRISNRILARVGANIFLEFVVFISEKKYSRGYVNLIEITQSVSVTICSI